MTNQCESGYKPNDLFEGWMICSACGLEHEQSRRIEWSFPWGYKATRCPGCGHIIEEAPGSSFPVQKTQFLTNSCQNSTELVEITQKLHRAGSFGD